MNAGRTVDVKVGQVGTPDAVAVPFAAVSVAKIELETQDCELETMGCLWDLARERGRALGNALAEIERPRNS